MRDPYANADYEELVYWGTQEAQCALVGCRGHWYERKIKEGCRRCGGGPYHIRCLEKHLRWCWQRAEDRLPSRKELRKEVRR